MTELKDVGLIIVDHGSTEKESNEMFETIVKRFSDYLQHPYVIAAHMELASPNISEAFEELVKKGVKEIIVLPYFLLPGKHSQKDIPRLVQESAQSFPSIRWKVAEPLGVSPYLFELLKERLSQALSDEKEKETNH